MEAIFETASIDHSDTPPKNPDFKELQSPLIRLVCAGGQQERSEYFQLVLTRWPLL